MQDKGHTSATSPWLPGNISSLTLVHLISPTTSRKVEKFHTSLPQYLDYYPGLFLSGSLRLARILNWLLGKKELYQRISKYLYREKNGFCAGLFPFQKSCPSVRLSCCIKKEQINTTKIFERGFTLEGFHTDIRKNSLYIWSPILDTMHSWKLYHKADHQKEKL